MKTERNNLFTCIDLPEKERRNLTIFELIRKKGLISKPEISKVTGINIVSVSNYIENYISKKLISEKESDISSGGRKPELVELNKKDIFVAGVHIGADSICITLADLEAMPLKIITTPVGSSNDNSVLSETILAALGDAAKKASLDIARVSAMGLAISDAKYMGLGENVKKRLGIDVFIGGVAQCAAFGEHFADVNYGTDCTLYIYSDRGRGIFIRGSECFGAVGNDCEIELPENNNAAVENGEFGEDLKYLKPWSPLLGVVASARAQVARGIGTKIVDVVSGSVDSISVPAVINAAQNKDTVASDILRQVGTNLGVRIAYLINAFNPKVVIIGGGIEAAGNIVLDPVKSMVNRYAFKKQASRVKIRPGTLGPDAACIGAASLTVREVFLRA